MTTLVLGMLVIVALAVGVLAYAAWPNVRSDEQVVEDAEKVRAAAKKAAARSRAAAETVAHKVGQSAASISGRSRQDG